MNLLQIKDNGHAVILSVPEGEAGQRLEALGLRAGKRIQKISGMPFSGPVTVDLDGRHFAVAHGIAAQIEVVPSEEGRIFDASRTLPKPPQ